MYITLNEASIGTGLGAAVPPLSLWIGPGAPSVVRVETAERPMLVSLLIGGRLRPEHGRVLVDGNADLDVLRRRSALVDTPVVAEPNPGATLASVVAEEFVFASRRASRSSVLRFLQEHDLAEYAKVPARALPPAVRVRLLCELALLRPGVEALVLTSPERHGGEPELWYAALEAIAERGVTVVVVTDALTADALAGLGARDATVEPPQPETTDPAEPLSLEA